MAEMKVGCVVVVEHPPESGKYVLIEETKPNKKGRKNLPGGGVDAEIVDDKPVWESVVKCAIRETKEESNLKVRLMGYLGFFGYTQDGQLHHAFAATSTGGKMKTSDKHPTVETYSLEEVEALHYDGQLRSDRVLSLINQSDCGIMLPMEAVHVELTDAVLPKPRPHLAQPSA
jgi:ADP-ribose pyrophosphatase YjhB (NUDIX family)